MTHALAWLAALLTLAAAATPLAAAATSVLPQPARADRPRRARR